MNITLDPMVGSKIEYIWASHPKPWHLSVGEIGRVKIEDNCIRIGFSVSLHEAQESKCWDSKNDRLFVEVLDSDNRTVMNNWINFNTQTAIVANLCLGETSV